jgi:hypothetical protein
VKYIANDKHNPPTTIHRVEFGTDVIEFKKLMARSSQRLEPFTGPPAYLAPVSLRVPK